MPQPRERGRERRGSPPDLVACRDSMPPASPIPSHRISPCPTFLCVHLAAVHLPHTAGAPKPRAPIPFSARLFLLGHLTIHPASQRVQRHPSIHPSIPEPGIAAAATNRRRPSEPESHARIAVLPSFMVSPSVSLALAPTPLGVRHQVCATRKGAPPCSSRDQARRLDELLARRGTF
ncbi:hypothetical protein F5144DRAFT_69032 [Chaetomium tenue]|uniref:Uncharacterized protein n=1 Tax=Chaetomium tenue TaxID=1854479 RepID=A0ACB7PPB5_9PEZI|nr:hypothetical protein F5144DRAFT_69032 [Chaetomium globosum]